MKTRLLFTALMIAAISCCWNPPLEAALPAGAQWEVRTTGNDLNGGFFNTAGGSGTDYSQQDAAQLTVTDGVTSTTTLTSITGGFTAAMVHNGVQLSGGTCTAGIYEITVVTNSNTVTIDSSGGAAGAGCTVKVGGGLLTIAKALANVVTNSGNTFNTIWVKSGTYTQTATLTWGTAITAAMQGYNTTHGDLGTAPLITTATDSTVLMVIGNVDQVTLTNLSMSNTATVRAIGISSNNGGGDVVRLNAVNVILDGFTNGINTTTTTFKRLFLSGVEIKNSTAAGILFTENTVKFISIVGSYIHNNTGAGLSNAGTSGLSLFVRSSVFDSNAGNGLIMANSQDQADVESSDFTNNTGAGILSAASIQFAAQNCIFYGNSTYGVNVATGASYLARSNAYGANGTAPTNNFPSGSGDVTLSANPFTSSTNFALNATAGGGAALKAVGFPGAFIGGTTTGYPDIGAVQSQASAGGGGASFAFVQ